MSVMEQTLLKTPLHDTHVAAGARMVPFAGWSMPVQYEGVIAEHNWVRHHAGIFDVSHMGVAFINGENAAGELQRLLSNDINKISEIGAAQYTLLTNESGGIEDDLIVYRLAADRFMTVLNASNVDHDVAWIESRLGNGVTIDNQSSDWSIFAFQGPEALQTLYEELNIDLRDAKPFQFVEAIYDDVQLYAATTGYTGERGCELVLPNSIAVLVWDTLNAVGNVKPIGLAARDTLRLEVCYPLHGNDIDPSTSAVSAGLGWVCGWDTDFIGKDALVRDKEDGTARKLVAIEATERAIPRAGCNVLIGDEVVGVCTSGTMSPLLEKGIAMAYVDSAHCNIGTEVSIDVRGKMRSAQIVKKPFYIKES